jgi:DNA-directed RNA polymerase specialized sigma24 family protein
VPLSTTNKANTPIKRLSFYEYGYISILTFFAAKILDKKTAEDLTSETFVTFVKHVKNNTEIENIRAYLYGIARNVFLLHLRRKYKIS